MNRNYIQCEQSCETRIGGARERSWINKQPKADSISLYYFVVVVVFVDVVRRFSSFRCIVHPVRSINRKAAIIAISFIVSTAGDACLSMKEKKQAIWITGNHTHTHTLSMGNWWGNSISKTLYTDHTIKFDEFSWLCHIREYLQTPPKRERKEKTIWFSLSSSYSYL